MDSVDKSEFRNEILLYLSRADVENEYINIMMSALDESLINYDINKSKYEIVPFNQNNFKYLELFLVTKNIEGKSEKTIERYKYILNQFLCYFQEIQLSEISVYHIREYLDYLKYNPKRNNAKHMSNTSLDGIRRIINNFFMWLFNEGLLKENPCKKLSCIKSDTKEEDSLTVEEFELLILNCKNPRDRVMIQFALDTACRVNELSDIKIRDINFNNNTCNIINGKGNKKRKVYFTERSVVYLNEYFSFIKKKFNIELTLNDNLFISFLTKNGLSDDGIRGMMNRIGERCNVKIHPHRLRVTCITSLLNKGMPLQKVSNIAGHTDPSTTMGYWRANNEDIHYEYNKYSN